MTKAAPLIVLLLASVSLLWGCGDDYSSAKSGESPSGADASQTATGSAQDAGQAPDASTPQSANEPIAILDAAGLTALRSQAAADGKVLVVDCWATWCGSCVAMFPHLHKAMKERGDDVLLVSLSFDEGEKLTEQAAAFLAKHDATDNAYRATEGSDAKDAVADALSEQWDGGALPAIFVYNRDGSPAYELLETRGEVKDWVAGIAAAVDASLASERRE